MPVVSAGARLPRSYRFRAVSAVPLALLGALVAVAPASADAPRQDLPPVLANILRDAVGAPAAENAISGFTRLPEIRPHDARLDLDIVYTESTIYNPATGRDDKVRLRSYRGKGTNPKIPFVAPTIEIQPGETVRIGLNNQLPPEPNCTPPDINTPHCFNSTNLHSHGLWVSPTGNSDNVLLTIRPTVSFQYEYNVPFDHPAGTFWYHPHLHGSTALQVSSGMAGTLIIRGSRKPTPEKNGDIDTLLSVYPDGKPVVERVLEFQQVQYACRDKNGQIKVEKDAAGKVIAWVCDPGDVGTIESYDQFGPNSWQESNRYTSINGQVLPTFAGVAAGRLERWRAVHAGVRNTVTLQFKKMRANAPTFDKLRAADLDAWAHENCTGDVLPQWEIAADGLTHAQMIEKTQNVLQPGYRSDVLVVFPEAGEYCVIDAAAPANSAVGNIEESRQVLGKVLVSKGVPVGGDIRKFLTTQLQAMAGKSMRPDMREKVKAALGDNLQTGSFVPHPTIEQVNGYQDVEFNIVTTQTPPLFQVNGHSYDPTQARTLILGKVEEWTITSKLAGHPFHIHVNPFQVVKILDPAGNDVSEKGEPNDPQYANLKGTWKDTLFVKQNYKIVMRTRYQRYIGEYVLHCHILDHEDQGMMQNINMVLPDGQGGGITGHH
ncbi:multicopper oxidase family protein [Tahibacter amnicola]|uniref:Multicopper oxidase domain-containing protein n=1 Tax=Tahibacter amnicola TaxID=2976241 RepID=A0ABY6BIU5_9GAMM|nr:multicopper oxidase domain-containing protein [Tahibacter amnicola]UXI69933.1 multicopper oxidase domain-containing protein [Tahibacter amnicola]